jgi:hypothetical protein
VGARTEALYALVSERLSSDEAVRSNDGRAALVTVARRFLAAASRRFVIAADRQDISLHGPNRALSIRQIQIRADAEALAQINADLDSLIDKFTSLSVNGEQLTVTLVVTPGI